MSRRRKIAAFVLLLIVVGALFFLANSESHRAARTTERVLVPKEKRIQAEVLNGAGGTKLAQQATQELRNAGIDVVEYGNYKSSTVLRTLVIDRAGSLEHARLVARRLRLPEIQVVQQIDKSSLVDVTVLLGKDFANRGSFPEENN